MLLGHGANIRKIADTYKVKTDNFFDFSSNINPLGISPTVKNIIKNAASALKHYPDPESKLAREVLADYLGVDSNNILLANGSNELIYLIPWALGIRRALIYHPAFSEYEFSIRLAGAKPYSLLAKEVNGFSIDIKMVKKYAPKVDLVILANPNNPTGYLLEKKQLLGLIAVCSKHKTYLLIDEVFIDFVKDQDRFSLLKEATRYKHLLVLRSFTKFFSLPGLRIGYLIAGKELIRKVSRFQPTWSVNSLAQEIVRDGLLDAGFIKKTTGYIIKERHFLLNRLKEIKGIYPYFPAANFIFCKILDKKLNSECLSRCLIKLGIIIRDCSNFKGLDNRFFRVAVRKRKENTYLISCLKRIFK